MSSTGGHLGSNLGAVELTLALHRVFDSPRGHPPLGHRPPGLRPQAPHRPAARRSTTLRQAGGLSGYPSRAESEHDWVENSHASTSTSYAYGLAMALDQSDGATIARSSPCIGDGAMTGGMAYEALNNLGHTGRKAVIVLNDNGRSYAPTVSRISESVSRMRLHPVVPAPAGPRSTDACATSRWWATTSPGVWKAPSPACAT